MAKSLTIQNKQGEDLYPVSVSSLIYDRFSGESVEQTLDNKQDTLVSGTNIKTINNNSILGSGNIAIPKGDKGDPLTYADLTAEQKAEIAQPATEQATIAAGHLATIQSALDNLDPSQSTNDAITALTAQLADIQADVDELSPKMDVLDDLIIPESIEENTTTSFSLTGVWSTYGHNVGTTWASPYNVHNYTTCVRQKLTFVAGDQIRIWGKGTNMSSLWVALDKNDLIKAKSSNGGSGASVSTTITQENPQTLNPNYDGTLLVSSESNVSYGVTILHTIPAVLLTADNEHDGLLSKETASLLGDNFVTMMDDILQEPYTEEISIPILYVNNVYRNHNTAAVGTTWNPSPSSYNGITCTKHEIKKDDVLNIWGKGTGSGSLYTITDENHIVKQRDYGGTGTEPAAVTQENPVVITSPCDGTVYLNFWSDQSYGAKIFRHYNGAKRATLEQDGLMSKEQVSIMNSLSAALENQTGGLSNKLIAVIGDSFSAPNAWQTRMNQILGSTSYNVAVSGGRWASTDATTDAYNQALRLVTAFENLEKKPDYILCVLGVNDVNDNVTMGDIVYTDVIGSGGIDYSTFTGGAQAILTVLKQNFPQAIIKVGFTPAGMMYLQANATIVERAETYLTRLQKIANLYGVDYIETRACGICRIVSQEFNMFKSDGHPNSDGHTRIGEYMARLLLSNL